MWNRSQTIMPYSFFAWLWPKRNILLHKLVLQKIKRFAVKPLRICLFQIQLQTNPDRRNNRTHFAVRTVTILWLTEPCVPNSDLARYVPANLKWRRAQEKRNGAAKLLGIWKDDRNAAIICWLETCAEIIWVHWRIRDNTVLADLGKNFDLQQIMNI